MPSFRNVLIATDGSARSRRATRAGVAFAKAVGATVIAYHALELVRPHALAEGAALDPSGFEAFEEQAEARAAKHLARVAKAASAAHVRCETYLTRPVTAYLGIIDAAKRKKCDVIFMASHGRGALAALILGSVTQQVLAHSKLPVIVYR